jgi:protein ImuB
MAARPLMLLLCGWLAARQRATAQLRLEAVQDAAQTPICIEMRLAQASRDPERMTAWVREHLAGMRLAAPVHTLRLHCEDSIAWSEPQPQLWATPQDGQQQLGRLIERLQARLGADQVQQLQQVEDHRPERAYQWVPAQLQAPKPTQTRQPPQARSKLVKPSEQPVHQDDPATPPLGALPRPIWLLEAPIALSERDNRPFWRTPMRLVAGPERIETGWWDGHLVQRDYFIAEDEDHLLYWIYRQRLPGDTRAGWFMQGRFG